MIADSRRAMMLHESGHQPIYYFPPEDVRDRVPRAVAIATPTARRRATRRTTRSASATHVVDAGAWYYPEPLAGAPPIKDLIAFYWNRMDHWFEEDEEVFVHPRDPYHRVDLLASDRHVRVSLDGELLAESRRALALFETNLPARWYLPREDVIASLEPSDTVTRCPYKGDGELPLGAAVVRGARAGSRLVLPRADRRCVADPGLLCFFNERVDIELDGELQERPESPWSRGVKSEAPNLDPAQTRG